jgi:hypothetical protein
MMPQATFHPQAWVNDYAVEVDPEGETQWEVTEGEIEAVCKEYDVDRQRAMESDQYESDQFRFSQNAPQWVRDWPGPFYISFDDTEAYELYEKTGDERLRTVM